MLAKILHEIYAYQIFQSVFFRASMGFLTSYFLTSILMPPFIGIGLQPNAFEPNLD